MKTVIMPTRFQRLMAIHVLSAIDPINVTPQDNASSRERLAGTAGAVFVPDAGDLGAVEEDQARIVDPE
jgi:hypothetical protein